MSLGGKIKIARKTLGLTQSDISERLGVSIQAVSQWETDRTTPSYQNLADLAKILPINLEDGLPLRDTVQYEARRPAVRAPVVSWASRRSWGVVEMEGDLPDFDAPELFLEIVWKPIGEVYALEVSELEAGGQFKIGDHIIIDTGRSAEQGDFVVADVEKHGLKLGQYYLRGTDKHRAPIFQIHAARPSGTTIFDINSESPGQVVGTLREHRCYYRSS